MPTIGTPQNLKTISFSWVHVSCHRSNSHMKRQNLCLSCEELQQRSCRHENGNSETLSDFWIAIRMPTCLQTKIQVSKRFKEGPTQKILLFGSKSRCRKQKSLMTKTDTQRWFKKIQVFLNSRDPYQSISPLIKNRKVKQWFDQLLNFRGNNAFGYPFLLEDLSILWSNDLHDNPFQHNWSLTMSSSNPAFKEGGDLRRCDQHTPWDHSLTLASDLRR